MPAYQKLPSGKTRAIIRKGGIYKSRAFRTKGEAQKWAVQLELAMDGGSTTGLIAPPRGMTLTNLIDAYLAQVDVGRTVHANLKRIKNRIGKTPVATLSALTLRGFIDQRLAEGAGGATLSGDLSNLSSVLKWARHYRRIEVNADLAKEARKGLTVARIDTRSNGRQRVPTDKELSDIIAYLAANDRMLIPAADIVRFAATSAMRLSEITRIRIEDINWNEQSVIIKERKDPKRKARNHQIVPLFGEAFDIARRHAEGRTEGEVFPYNPRSAGTAFRRACRSLGIEDLHFHDLRHLAITA